MDLKEKLESMKGDDENTNEVVEQEVSFEAGAEEVSEGLNTEETHVPEETTEEESPIETTMLAQAEDNLVLEEVNSEKEEYVPNFKYKAVGEEFEFDEELKGIINNKETEEKYRSLFAKAKGLDFFTAKHEKLEDQFNTLTMDHESKMKDATELAGIVNDFNSKVSKGSTGEKHRALVEAGIDEQSILNVAKQILDLRDLSPQQQNAYNQQYQQRDELKDYERQLTETRGIAQQAQQQAAESQVNAYLATQDGFIKEFEARDGKKSGDFRNSFIKYGKYLVSSGMDVDLETAMSEFKSVHNLGNLKPVQPAPVQTVQQVVHTIPNVQSSGHSPIQKGYKTMDDLRKDLWK